MKLKLSSLVFFLMFVFLQTAQAKLLERQGAVAKVFSLPRFNESWERIFEVSPRFSLSHEARWNDGEGSTTSSDRFSIVSKIVRNIKLRDVSSDNKLPISNLVGMDKPIWQPYALFGEPMSVQFSAGDVTSRTPSLGRLGLGLDWNVTERLYLGFEVSYRTLFFSTPCTGMVPCEDSNLRTGFVFGGRF